MAVEICSKCGEKYDPDFSKGFEHKCCFFDLKVNSHLILEKKTRAECMKYINESVISDKVDISMRVRRDT